MKAIELRSKSINELKDLLLEHRKEALNIRFQVVSGQFENLARKRVVRKNVARLKTIITEKMHNDKRGS
ncbi:50S ribosomal protein L29 [Rickettsiales bacterium LUAb2]